MTGDAFIRAGIVVLGIGILLILTGILLQNGGGEIEGGGIIFIGPIPIVFGSRPRAVLLSIVIGLILLATVLPHTT